MGGDWLFDDPALARILSDSFDAPLEPLGADELVHEVSLSLLRLARGGASPHKQRPLDDAVLSRAREFLDANCLRVVTGAELERVCGHTRFTG